MMMNKRDSISGNINARLANVLDLLSKQREIMSSTNTDAFYSLIDERLRAKFMDVDAKLSSNDSRITSTLEKLDEVLKRLRKVEERVVSSNVESRLRSEDSDSEDANPEDTIDKLRQELVEKDIQLQDMQEKMVQQQAIFVEALKQSELMIRQLAGELQPSSSPLLARKSSYENAPRPNNNTLAPSDISPRLVSPRKSVSGPVGTPKTEKLTVVTQSQFTLESEVSYPPGYNPNRRRGSVSAESPSRYPKAVLNIVPKSVDVKLSIKNSVTRNILFKGMDEEQLEKLADVMFEKKVKAGEIVIKQGDDGDNFYVVDKGELNVIRDGKHVSTLGNGRFFGELALMYNVPRMATVQAVADTSLWGMDRIAFRTILMEYSIRKRQLYEKFLEGVPLLGALTPYERATVADALEGLKFEDGDVILSQGEAGDIFYILEEGEVRVTQSRSIYGNAYGKPIEVTRLYRGDYFGEIALLTNKPRAANVIAIGPARCLALNRKDFTQLLGPCSEILKRNMNAYKTYEDILKEHPELEITS